MEAAAGDATKAVISCDAEYVAAAKTADTNMRLAEGAMATNRSSTLKFCRALLGVVQGVPQGLLLVLALFM